jgi:hypothetical protein
MKYFRFWQIPCFRSLSVEAFGLCQPACARAEGVFERRTTQSFDIVTLDGARDVSLVEIVRKGGLNH